MFFLSSCSCSKEGTSAAPLTFEAMWEKYDRLCYEENSKQEVCSELAVLLDEFTPAKVTEETLQLLVKECNGENENACVVLAWYFLRTKKYKSAISFASSVCPNKAYACFYVGEAFTSLNMLGEGLDFYERACSLDIAAACGRIGHFYLGEQKLEGAISYFNKSCELKNSYGCYNLACLYSLTGKLENSFSAISLALGYGFNDWETILTDKDLDKLRGSKDLEALVSQYKE